MNLFLLSCIVFFEELSKVFLFGTLPCHFCLADGLVASEVDHLPLKHDLRAPSLLFFLPVYTADSGAVILRNRAFGQCSPQDFDTGSIDQRPFVCRVLCLASTAGSMPSQKASL